MSKSKKYNIYFDYLSFADIILELSIRYYFDTIRRI